MNKTDTISAQDFRQGYIPPSMRGKNPGKKKWPKGIREDVLQMQVAGYLDAQYPGILWFHPANERKTKVIRKKNGAFFTPEGNRLKKKGVKPGIPDNLIFEPRGEYFGLAVELKIKPNKPTAEQLVILQMYRSRSWQTAVCYTFEEAKEVIDGYFKQ